MNSLITEIRGGILDLDANRDERFGFMVESIDVPLNYLKSTGFNEIKIGRAFAYQPIGEKKLNKKENSIRVKTNEGRFFSKFENNLLSPNYDLLGKKCFLIRLSKYSFSNEEDVSFTIDSIVSIEDHLWFPDRINEEDDIWIESATLKVSLGEGVL